MKYNPITRRMFLVGAGNSVLSIPVLTSLLGRKAEAQMASSPLRFIRITNPYSPNENTFYGVMAPRSGYASAPGNALAGSVNYKALAGPTGELSYILAPLTQFKDKISVIRGLDLVCSPNTDHPQTFAACAAGTVGGDETKSNGRMPSVDVMIANGRLTYSSSVPANRRLVVSNPCYFDAGGDSFTFDKVTATGAPERVSPVASTDLLLQRFIANFPSGGGTTPAPTPTGVTRADIMNLVYQDYLKVKNDPRLAAADKVKLDSYMSLVSEIQRSLGSVTSPPPIPAATSGCKSPVLEADVTPARPPSVEGKRQGEGDGSFLQRSASALTQTNTWRETARANEDIRIRNHIKIIAAAMACDLTRVASFSFGFDGQWDMSHSYDHSGNMWSDRPTASAFATAFFEQHRRKAAHMALLMQTLGSLADVGGGNILDNSIIYWGQEFGLIVDPGDGHSQTSMPVVIGGGAGGKLTTGNYIDYRPAGARNGLPLNNLLVTFMNCFGLGSSDYEYSAGSGYGTYDGQTSRAPASALSTSGKRTALPFLYRGPVIG